MNPPFIGRRFRLLHPALPFEDRTALSLRQRNVRDKSYEIEGYIRSPKKWLTFKHVDDLLLLVYPKF